MNKLDMALNNLEQLICHKAQLNERMNQPTNQLTNQPSIMI